MPLFINKEKIDEKSIKKEMDRMRGDFRNMYPELDKITREKTLFDWAKENLIERVLLNQYAENNNISIQAGGIDKSLEKIKRNFSSENELSEFLDQQDTSLPEIKHGIRQILLAEKVKENLVKYCKETEKEQKINNFVDDLKDHAVVEYKETKDITDSAKASFILKKPLNFVLVKPSGPDCNLACQYCFYREKAGMFDSRKHRMNDQVLQALIRKVVSNNPDNIHFGWQGGEPTLLGIDFFRKAIELQQRFSYSGQTISNSIQTNGVLISAQWADFLKENNFLVGLSIDGPESVHDKYRTYKNGKGTFHQVEKAAALLFRHKIPVNSLTAINDYSVRFPEKIYSYLTSLGFRFLQFIPIVEMDKNKKTTAPYSATGAQYGEFLCRIFDLWKKSFYKGNPTVSVRFFDAVFHTYINREAPQCSIQKECGNYIVVEHTGDVYACDFFVQSEWKLGNILYQDPRLLLNSAAQKKFGEMKSIIPDKCKLCNWLTYCRGGCLKDRRRNPRNNNISHFCTGYKMFFEYADSYLKKLAENYLLENSSRNSSGTKSDNSNNNTFDKKTGRNDPCPCGSGIKFKMCCSKS